MNSNVSPQLLAETRSALAQVHNDFVEFCKKLDSESEFKNFINLHPMWMQLHSVQVQLGEIGSHLALGTHMEDIYWDKDADGLPVRKTFVFAVPVEDVDN